LWDHDVEKIETLHDFVDYYDKVLEIFEKNNLVDEYEKKFRNTEKWHVYPSFDQCKQRLLKLKTAIQHLGVREMKKKIEEIMQRYKNIDPIVEEGLVERDMLLMILTDTLAPILEEGKVSIGNEKDAKLHRILERLKSVSR
jgi:hypothetical protein